MTVPRHCTISVWERIIVSVVNWDLKEWHSSQPRQAIYIAELDFGEPSFAVDAQAAEVRPKLDRQRVTACVLQVLQLLPLLDLIRLQDSARFCRIRRSKGFGKGNGASISRGHLPPLACFPFATQRMSWAEAGTKWTRAYKSHTSENFAYLRLSSPCFKVLA